MSSTPDCHLLALDNRTGKEKWRTEICDLDQFYYASAAPLIVKNHVIVGVSGDDLDIPGYIESHDPETGALQWRWYTHPEPGTPEAKTWPSVEAMLHGGGMTWGSTTYDPELNLIYFGTGNPQPVINGRKRQGDNLYTESIVALNPDTGRLAWYFQSSPHDTHDWDATQTPVLFDGTINGQPRKLLAQAARNGWFFVLDRETGRNISSTEYVKTNWTQRPRRQGPADSEPAQGAAGRRRARVAEPGRRPELAAAKLQSADGPLLRQRDARLQRVLPLRERERRQAAGLGRQRPRRLVRGHAARPRLPDRQGALALLVGRERQHAIGPAVHGGQSAVRGRLG